jgi:hypothetical protein
VIPAAVTLNVAVCPLWIVRLCGWAVIEGATHGTAVIVAVLLSTLAQGLLTRTQKLVLVVSAGVA